MYGMYKQKIDSGVQFKSTNFFGAHFEISQKEAHSYKIDIPERVVGRSNPFWGKSDFLTFLRVSATLNICPNAYKFRLQNSRVYSQI